MKKGIKKVELTIYKYDIPIEDEFSLDLPVNCKILSVQTQLNEGRMWILVNPNSEKENRTFRVAGTGHPIEENEAALLNFIGTFQINNGVLVFHLFERLKES